MTIRRLLSVIVFVGGTTAGMFGLAPAAIPAFGADECPPTCTSTSIENNPCPNGPCGTVPNSSPCPGGTCGTPSQSSPCPNDPNCGKLEPATASTPGAVNGTTGATTPTTNASPNPAPETGGPAPTSGSRAAPGASTSASKGKTTDVRTSANKLASSSEPKRKGFPAGSLALTIVVCVALTGVVLTVAGSPRRRVS